MNAVLVWGLFPRLLAVVYLIAFASLFAQVVPLAGACGIHPIRPQLLKIRSDYPAWRCYLSFPTLLWLRADDWCLRLLVVAGAGGAVWVVYGGSWSNLGLLICWVCYMSLNHAAGLVYPWDCLLLEAGFVAVLLPSGHPLPDWSAVALPLPAVAWAYRWLLFRVVFGFGKFKFLGMSRKDLGYLRNFFIAVPLPGPLGWYAHHLPGWALKLGLLCLFLVEVPTPFLIFVPGYPRLAVALAIATLMAAIQLTGNYGHFNLLAIVLCVPLLDADASLFDQSLAGVLWPWSHLLTHVVVLILFVGGLLYFPFNSWCTQAWLYWPSLFRGPARRLGWLLAFYRFLAPFRILHAYGVFPPISFPPARAVPVIEGTPDGKEWREYSYRWLMSRPTSPCVWVAPHTPRLDQHLFYEASGTDVSNFLGPIFAFGNPYLFSRSSGIDRLVQRLLEGKPGVVKLFANNPFPDGPPVAIRVSLYMLEPTTLAQRRQTGAWWRRRYLGPHLPAVTLDRTVWDEWLPDPELFHPDDLIWKLRAPHLRALFNRARSGDSLATVVVDPSAGICAEDLQLFWHRLFVAASREERCDWKELPLVVQRIRQTFSREQLRVCERVLGRLCLALFARLEPFYVGGQEPRIDLETHFQMNMLIAHLIAQGEGVAETVYREPARAPSLVATMTNETGLFLTAVFWYEKMAYLARKFRLLRRYYALEYMPGLTGFLLLIPFLAEQFEVPGEEVYPTFVRRTSDGEWLLEQEGEMGKDSPRVFGKNVQRP
jgi:hypothetical protein